MLRTMTTHSIHRILRINSNIQLKKQTLLIERKGNNENRKLAEIEVTSIRSVE